MILVLTKEAKKTDGQALAARLERMGFQVVLNRHNGSYALAIVKGIDDHTHLEHFTTLPFVEKVVPFNRKFKLAGRDFQQDRSVIDIRGRKIGNRELMVMAGPCSIESEAQIFDCARIVSQHGASVLRGGAFKPRSSPYDFQGLGETGLRYLRDAADKYNLLTVSEVMDTSDVALVAEYADILQIGTRNMQNFSLLRRVGQRGKPVLLKRGFSATYNDFLLAAEYILSEGNPDVILCERGIRTFETHTRNTLDIAAVPILHELTHLPVVVDPSHATGIRQMVAPMARVAVAAEADGLMIEVHPEPDKAVSDAAQTIDARTFAEMMTSLRKVGQAVGIRVK